MQTGFVDPQPRPLPARGRGSWPPSRWEASRWEVESDDRKAVGCLRSCIPTNKNPAICGGVQVRVSRVDDSQPAPG